MSTRLLGEKKKEKERFSQSYQCGVALKENTVDRSLHKVKFGNKEEQVKK